VDRSSDGWTRWAAVAAIVAAAASVLPRWHTVVHPDVAARVVLGCLWVAVWLLAALGAGRLVLRWAGLGNHTGWGGTLGTGTAVLSFLATMLAATGLLRTAILLTVLAASVVAGGLTLLRRGGPAPPWAGGRVWPWALLAFPAAVQLLGITAPPVFYDSLNYHLAFPARWLASGGWVEFPRHAYSYYPAAVDILDVFALAGVGGWGGRAIGLAFSWIAALAAGELGGLIGGRRAAWWAAALFLLTPSVLQTGPLAAADSGTAAWAGAALLVLLAGSGRARPVRAVVLAGFIGGSAFAGKYLAAATVVLPLAAAALVASHDPRIGRVRRLALLGAGGLLAATPWLLRNLAWTGNPFHPYLAPLFGLPASGMTIAGELAQNARPVAGTARYLAELAFALPVRTFHPLQVGGVIGPQWLLLLVPAILLVRGRVAAPLWAAVGTGLAGWGALVQFGRFLLPVLVPLAALCGAAAARVIRPSRPRDPVPHALILLLGTVLVWNASAVLDPMAAERIDVVVGRESDGEFRRHWISYWPAVEAIGRLVPAGGRVLLVGEVRAFGIPREVEVEDPYHPPLLVELARHDPDPEAILSELRARGVSHVLLNRTEMGRIARMRGLPGYFGEASPVARDAIRTFLAALPRIWTDGPLELLELQPGHRSPRASERRGPDRRR